MWMCVHAYVHNCISLRTVHTTQDERRTMECIFGATVCLRFCFVCRRGCGVTKTRRFKANKQPKCSHNNGNSHRHCNGNTVTSTTSSTEKLQWQMVATEATNTKPKNIKTIRIGTIWATYCVCICGYGVIVCLQFPSKHLGVISHSLI